ncbi:cell envelope protein (plasmid) [Microvirga ossetica]|uniref:Cell envelope protein n=1 Tax=Microvirga ossetica TaxID=1882682 RepID=A0A1B2EY68_9HYPH|nr:DUF1254 domain-containing protein [Microvirga ossetica]ANY84883.1 cell envelope protein [Microvirga ossetica]
MLTKRDLLLRSAALAAITAATMKSAPVSAQTDVTPTEARAIAKEAYIYGFPIVDNYRIQHAYWVDRTNPEYKGGFNQVWNASRLFSPADTAIQTPNSDTLYSMIGADLRAEPLVLTVPAMEKDRYFSIQFIDYYTFNFDYAGTRTTGNGGGTFLLAGPGWKGETPKGIDKVFRSETELAFPAYRTQLFNPGDIENVKKVQAGYRVQALSAFLGQPAPKAATAIDFIEPLTPDQEKASLKFFTILNFVLQFCPTVTSETELMARFARIGVGAGKTLNVNSPEMKAAIEQGMADAWKELQDFERTEINTGRVTPANLFGTREFLKNNYLNRWTGVVLGIYANSKAEALYPIYRVDAAGDKLDASKNRYVLRFAPGQLPPVNAFWSLTMYDLPQSLLVANPLNRYLINSPMLPNLKLDADGGLTIYIQRESPGADKEANWLPAPKDLFWTALRLYWPKEEAVDGKWKHPPLNRVT